MLDDFYTKCTKIHLATQLNVIVSIESIAKSILLTVIFKKWQGRRRAREISNINAKFCYLSGLVMCNTQLVDGQSAAARRDDDVAFVGHGR